MMSLLWLYFNQRTLSSSKTKFRGDYKWTAINRAIEYGKNKGVTVKVTQVK